MLCALCVCAAARLHFFSILDAKCSISFRFKVVCSPAIAFSLRGWDKYRLKPQKALISDCGAFSAPVKPPLNAAPRPRFRMDGVVVDGIEHRWDAWMGWDVDGIKHREAFA